eukprot:CAMPEP_0175643554 /NCGR_PEP_ID=MMETSP0097-20121207/5854_1 /TAXON_ID=311494 /ORGANISM="Alexandrium monilatum, Strain CCMP3105" /LENGTH=183 /DNA_ID=CAMNT_0016949401 /DNA_START=26 /DNA_END=576 /DNA_ORIENTATION=+
MVLSDGESAMGAGGGKSASGGNTAFAKTTLELWAAGTQACARRSATRCTNAEAAGCGPTAAEAVQLDLHERQLLLRRRSHCFELPLAPWAAFNDRQGRLVGCGLLPRSAMQGAGGVPRSTLTIWPSAGGEAGSTSGAPAPSAEAGTPPVAAKSDSPAGAIGEGASGTVGPTAACPSPGVPKID